MVANEDDPVRRPSTLSFYHFPRLKKYLTSDFSKILIKKRPGINTVFECIFFLVKFLPCLVLCKFDYNTCISWRCPVRTGPTHSVTPINLEMIILFLIDCTFIWGTSHIQTLLLHIYCTFFVILCEGRCRL